MTHAGLRHTQWECLPFRIICVKVGLSLTDAVHFFVCHFFARLGEKMTHNQQNVPCCRRLRCYERKS